MKYEEIRNLVLESISRVPGREGESKDTSAVLLSCGDRVGNSNAAKMEGGV